ncbi:MAG: subunit of meta cleavage enzyme [Pseudomonadota bacterium]
MAAQDTYRVNRMVQDLFAKPDMMALFQEDRAALYDRYELSQRQRDAVDTCKQDALASVGVHPILMMHLFLASDPAAADHISVKAYLPSGGSAHG